MMDNTIDFDLELFLSDEKVWIKMRIADFVQQSNMIEGIVDVDNQNDDIIRLEKLLSCDKLTIARINKFNAYGELRDKDNISNVMVGSHVAPKSGKDIRLKLNDILGSLSVVHPYQSHQDFESLHPYTDGNGRAGRAIWLWQMTKYHDYDLGLLFLHKFYYQSLEFNRI